MRLFGAIAIALLGGCGTGTQGTGYVEGAFTVLGCTSASDQSFPAFAFDVKHVVNRRNQDNMEVVLLHYPVDLEETDGLVMQFASVRALRTARAAVAPGPLTVELATGSAPARAALSLFVTCPSAPTLHAVAGSVTFTRLELQEDPTKAGLDEVVTGTLTASVSGPDRSRILGTIKATFDFVPENASQIGSPR